MHQTYLYIQVDSFRFLAIQVDAAQQPQGDTPTPQNKVTIRRKSDTFWDVMTHFEM